MSFLKLYDINSKKYRKRLVNYVRRNKKICFISSSGGHLEQIKQLTDVAKKEQNENARPAYQGGVPDLSKYTTIFIGAPVWWGDWPMICYTFFEENADALAGKTLIPFSTHEGSGLSGFDRKLEAAIPGATVLDGLAIRGNDAQNNQDNVRETVKNWLSDLGY